MAGPDAIYLRLLGSAQNLAVCVCTRSGPETMISADSLRGAIECGDFEDNGFARNREEAEKLGQALVEHGLVFDATLAH
jgi:hypothetical protein